MGIFKCNRNRNRFRGRLRFFLGLFQQRQILSLESRVRIPQGLFIGSIKVVRTVRSIGKSSDLKEPKGIARPLICAHGLVAGMVCKTIRDGLNPSVHFFIIYLCVWFFYNIIGNRFTYICLRRT